MTVYDSQAKLLGDVQGFNNPAGLEVNQATNKIYVLDAGAAEIRIIDGKNVAPVFTSPIPPTAGTVGVLYQHLFTASGSFVPQFRVASGALPPGLTLQSTGGLSGVPSTPGTYTFRIAASNGYGPDGVSPQISITIKTAKVGHDFNGDLKPDVLSRDGNGNLWLYPGQGNGGWFPRIQVGQGWNVMTSIVAPGDFNGDGNADLLARDGSGALWLYPGNGRGGWFARVQVGQGWSDFSMIVAAGDLDMNGTADVVARNPEGRLLHYFGLGSGGLIMSTFLGTGWHVLTSMVSPGDFDKNGMVDMLATDAAGTLRLYSGYKTGYMGPDTVGYGWNAMTAIVGPGDFNGDGNVDLLARDAGGALWLYPSNGQGGWLPRGLVGSGWNAMNLII
ncbi:FG-GAP-like repeat-containing protein [Paenarthrobacter sp. TAF1]|uniref:FG-GAP-like repeat-containing protein n=1 Tax=Paenarthrobacter sp. TAF1 TaxID=3233067 RepID=UPI003F96B4AF